MVFQGGECDVLGGLVHVGFEEEVGIECAKVKIATLSDEGLFEELVCFVDLVDALEHLGLTNLSYYEVVLEISRIEDADLFNIPSTYSGCRANNLSYASCAFPVSPRSS